MQVCLESLQKNYDYVVVDTPNSLTEPSLTVLDVADRIVYLTSLSIPSIKSTKQGLDVMQELHYPASKIYLLVNSLEFIDDIQVEDVQMCLQEPIRGVLPSDPHTVMDAINSGVTLLQAYPQARITQSLMQTVRSLIGYPLIEEPSHEKGWLARLRAI